MGDWGSQLFSDTCFVAYCVVLSNSMSSHKLIFPLALLCFLGRSFALSSYETKFRPHWVIEGSASNSGRVACPVNERGRWRKTLFVYCSVKSGHWAVQGSWVVFSLSLSLFPSSLNISNPACLSPSHPPSPSFAFTGCRSE